MKWWDGNLNFLSKFGKTVFFPPVLWALMDCIQGCVFWQTQVEKREPIKSNPPKPRKKQSQLDYHGVSMGICVLLAGLCTCVLLLLLSIHAT